MDIDIDHTREEVLSKTSSEVADFLSKNGIPYEIAERFEDEDIDGQAFLELSEADIKSVALKLGIVKKILRIQKGLSSAQQVPPFSPPLTPSVSNTRDSFSPVVSSPSLPSTSHTRDPFSPQRSPPTPFTSGRRHSFSPQRSPSLNESESDTVSLSSASQLIKSKFVIPDSWPPAIMMCINQSSEEDRRKHLTSSVRNEIIRALSVQMFCFDPKPKKDFCTQVCQMLVKKYPFMKDTGERVSGYGSWERKLIEKVTHNAYWASRKRDYDTDEDSAPKSKRGRPQQSHVLTRYPPLKNTNDDEVSNERNQVRLTEELSKDRPRKELILMLARQTFRSRRSDILAGGQEVTASSLLSKYKELEKPYVIIQEMDLILEKHDIFKVALNDWKTVWVPAILEYAHQSTGKAATMFLQAQNSHEGDINAEEKVALAALCILLPRKGVKDALMYISEVFKATDNPDEVASQRRDGAPRMASFPVDEGWQHFLVVEGKVVCSVMDFNVALCLWFSFHYLLNLEYCSKVREVALFFQEFVFKLPATSSIKKQKTATYLSVTTQMQSFASQNII